MNAPQASPAASTASNPAPAKMPRSIFFILSNEFAERFSFYGINSILAVYLANQMQFTEGRALTWQGYFKSAAYFTPLIGAVVADVFWGKYRTILVFSIVYAAGCVALAAVGQTPAALAFSLLFVAIGTGGIKPCVSTNVGDQFTAANQHLIERAYSLFYMSINAGSSISIFLCPILLQKASERDEWARGLPEGPEWAFGLPAVMMVFATIIFWAGRRQYTHVPPAGKAWLDEVISPAGLKLVGNLVVIYLFVSIFWMLWDQANGSSWTLQAQSSLMDKELLPGVVLLPAQIQVVNGLFILAIAPLCSYGLFPFVERFTRVTPLKKIGAGLFITGLSFVPVAYIEGQIQAGNTVSAWWQILAYVILTTGEVLVSITALEFSYKQAPLRIKSFVMALFLISVSVGNLLIAVVNTAIQKPLTATAVETGAQTYVTVQEASQLEKGQKIDFSGENGVTLADTKPLAGTFLVGDVDASTGRVRLIDVINRAPVSTTGTFSSQGKVSTYFLVGPDYFLFFIGVIAVAGVLFIFIARRYKEQTHVRQEPAT